MHTPLVLDVIKAEVSFPSAHARFRTIRHNRTAKEEFLI
jgi:hypothetical protein